MFSEFVICIFSYNRGEYLKNLLDSIILFYPDMDIAIFDDGSTDEDTVRLLNECKKKSIHVYQVSHNNIESKHGSLYSLMNIALQYASDNHYTYAYFVQDDMQFLWRDESLITRIVHVFQYEECLMCNFSFLQKILMNFAAGKLMKADKDGVLYSFVGNGVADTGIIHVEKALAADLRFKYKSEKENGEYWYNKNYRLYWLPQCHLAWIPWPTTYRFRKHEKREIHSLNPLSDQAISKVKSNKGYAYLEDYTSSKYFMIKPYWYSANPGYINLIKIYIKYFFRIT